MFVRRSVAEEHVHHVRRVGQPEKPREMVIDLRQPPRQEGFSRREAALVVESRRRSRHLPQSQAS